MKAAVAREEAGRRIRPSALRGSRGLVRSAQQRQFEVRSAIYLGGRFPCAAALGRFGRPGHLHARGRCCRERPSGLRQQ